MGVNSTKTNGISATASLTVGVDAVFGNMSTSMGISASASFSTGTSVSYNIAAKTANGKYRIDHVFPGMKVKQEKITCIVKTGKENVTWSRTISYAPRNKDAYRRLTRYAN